MEGRGDALERLLMNDLIAWSRRDHRKPLLLLGARQTGKTWLLEELGRRAFANCVTVDFMLDPQAAAVFERDLDPQRIIAALELRTSQRILPGSTLLILDEVQEAPRAITALKYFCERAPQYHVAAAGSYMGITLERQGASFPVGKVETLTLHPLGFEEFVRAVAGDPLADALHGADMELLSSAVDRLEALLKEYLVVGGMPEPVAIYAEGGDVAGVRRRQAQILADYDADFSKHAPARILERMRLVWQSVPRQLARENKKFVFGAVRPGGRARDFEESIQWLCDYGALDRVRRASALRVPLASYADVAVFKLFCLDVGLLGAMAGLGPQTLLEGSTLFTEFKGALTEQYVEQQLRLRGLAPAYWSNDAGSAEVDFAVGENGAVLPIEVKAAENLRAKSLKVACEKFGLGRAVRTSLSGYRDEGWLVNIPLWAIGSLPELV